MFWDLFSQKMNYPQLSRALFSKDKNTKVEEPLDTLFTRIRLSMLTEVSVMKTKVIMKKIRLEEVKVN